MTTFHSLRIPVALVLILAVLLIISPRPAAAQGGTIGGLVQCFMPSIQSLLSSIPVIGGFLSGGANEVPVNESKLRMKSCLDAVLTGILKDIIKIMRDMVLNWILTGRFGGPTFSGSFTIDAATIAENASRIFLSRLSGINFCTGITAGSIPSFSLSLSLSLSCSLSTNVNRPGADIDMFLHPERFSTRDRILALQPENLDPWVVYRALQAKSNAEITGLAGFQNEYQAGSGFLGIKDTRGVPCVPDELNVVPPDCNQNYGKSIFPADSVKELANTIGIKSPVNQTDVANTVQQAIASIIETALKVLVNKGFGAVR